MVCGYYRSVTLIAYWKAARGNLRNKTEKHIRRKTRKLATRF